MSCVALPCPHPSPSLPPRSLNANQIPFTTRRLSLCTGCIYTQFLHTFYKGPWQ